MDNLPPANESNLTVVIKPPKKKFALNKKVIFFSLGLIVVLASIFGIAAAVRYRQGLQKKAFTGPGLYACGVRVNPNKEGGEQKPTAENGAKYSLTYTIYYTGDNNDTSDSSKSRCDGPDEKTFTFQYWECVCPQGAGEPGTGYCTQCSKREETVTLKKSKSCAIGAPDENAITRTLSASQPGGQVCGSYQVDVHLLNCNGQDVSVGMIFGGYHTEVDCTGEPTPTPTPILSPTPTLTPEVTPTPTLTPTLTPTVTKEVTPTATVTAGPSLTPTATSAVSLTPTPTSLTPTPGACFSECQVDGDCENGNKCIVYQGTKRCLKSECPTEVDCGCNACWSLCTNDWECTTEMRCLTASGQRRCVKEACPESQNCTCEVIPTSTPRPTSTPAPSIPVTGIKITTAGGILGGFLLISLGLALIF